jgi:hypothetical protein
MQEDNQNQEEFFTKVKDKLEGIKALVKEYGLEEEFVMSYIGGVYRYNEEGDIRLAAQIDFVVEDEEELDELLSAQLEMYRITFGMTADEKEALPKDLSNTENWTSEDWMNYISNNSKGSA